MSQASEVTRIARKLGKRIRTVREQAKITQESLAWECDLSKPYVSQIESGQRLPSIGVLFRLAKRLGVDVRRLFDP